MLNERLRVINNTIEISSWESNTCINQLLSILDQVTFKEYQVFISRVREARQGVRERQVAAFNKSCLKTSGGHSKEHGGNGGGKEIGYMISNFSGHSNTSPTNITTLTAMTSPSSTTTASTTMTTTNAPLTVTSTPAPDPTKAK